MKVLFVTLIKFLNGSFFFFFTARNRPVSNCFLPLFGNECWFETIRMKINFIAHEKNKTRFHIKGFSPGNVSKEVEGNLKMVPTDKEL